MQVASMQTLQRRSCPDADIVIIDEAHRWFRFMGEWMDMPEWQQACRSSGCRRRRGPRVSASTTTT